MAAGEERRKQALLQGPIRRVQRRLNQEIWARGLVVPAWSAATALALYRFAFREHVAIAGFVLALGAGAFWIWRTRPHLVPLSRAAALTDQRVGAGGLLLTRLEVPVGDWELGLNERVRSVTLPEVALRKPLGQVALAALFLVAVLRVPLPPRPTPRASAAAATKLAQVEAKAEALAQERPIPEESTELARLRDELSNGRFDAADWEAADGLSQALEEKAAQRAAELAKAEAAAKSLEESLAQGASKEAESREQDALERALMALGDSGGQGSKGQGEHGDPGQDGAGEEGQQGEGDQSQQGDGKQGDGKRGDGKQGKQGDGKQGDGKQGDGKQGDGENGQQSQNGKQGQGGKQGQSGKQGTGTKGAQKRRSQAEASELRRALASRQRALEKSFGQGTGNAQPGSDSGKGGEEGEGEGNGPGRPRGPHPSELVKQGRPGGDGSGDGKGAGAAPGPGGGHEPLVFGGNARMDDPDRLEFSPLPKGQGGEAGDLWGLRGADPRPDVEHVRGAASGAAAEGERAPGTRAGPLLPRNRELVRRYFESK